MEDKIKEAFSKVKEDIFTLGKEVGGLKVLISDMKNELKILTQAFKDLQKPEKLPESQPKNTPTHPEKTPTNQQKTPTHKEIPTDNMLSQVLKDQNIQVSTGNQGVPTDRQTDRQTNRHIKIQEKPVENHLNKAKQILDNLDALKKELRIKIKRLTTKEMQVFTLLYDLEHKGEQVDYPLLSSKLSLSESSIRDYIGKITHKGIPIIKEKLNNKKIILHVSPDLKNLASLDTILKLRDL